jgi:hypothetical protein
LKCPAGTTSPRKSWCLGHCKINPNLKEPQATLNPVIAVFNTTSLDEDDPELLNSD